MHTSSSSPRRSARRVLVALVAAGSLAACADPSNSTSVATSAPSPATNDAPDQTAATTSVAPTVPAPVETVVAAPADWAAAAAHDDWRVLIHWDDDPNFHGPGAVYARDLSLQCSSTECATGTGVLSGTDEGEPFIVDTTFTTDGPMLVNSFTFDDECLDPATYEPTGPTNTRTEYHDEMEPQYDGATLVGFVGTRRFTAVTEASDQCVGEELSGSATVVYYRPATALSGTVDAPLALRGGLTDSETIDAAIRPCDDDTCDLILRLGVIDADAAGAFRLAPLDVSLLFDGSAHQGTATWTSYCTSDVDGAFVTEAGYTITADVTAHVYQLGSVTIVDAEVVRTATTLPALPAEQAALCAPFSRTEDLRYRDIPTQEGTIGWSETAVNA